MGIQINGQTDTITAVDGALTVSGADLPTVTNLNATGLITARSGLHVTGGSVGIGTDNPGSKLHIISTNNVPLRVQSPTADSYINFVNSQNTNGYIGYETQALTFYTNNTERLRITSTGNIGIGTDNPQYKLEVQQPSTPTIAVRNTTTSSYSRLIAGGYDSTGEFFAFQRLGSTNGGYGGAKAGQIWNYADAPIVMGIGSTERLRVTSNGIINSSNYSFNGIGTASASDVYLGSFAPGGNAWAVASLGVERMRIDSSGRVTMPYQPAFCVSRQDGASTTTSHNVPDFTTSFFNIGNHYDLGNNRFTAPVSGTYFFSGHVIPTGLAQNSPFEMWISVNSSTVSTNRRFLDRAKKNEADSNTYSLRGSVAIYLSANDYVQLTTTTASYSDETNSKFSGFLIG